MKLIIDCGSTKADWVIINDDNTVKKFQTEGFNPNYTDKKTISSIILNNNFYNIYIQDIKEIYFYGSGCGNEKNCKLIYDILSSIFVNSKINVTHDMMAACHAISGDKEGIVCILGTGSNSCFYNGKDITDKAVSLGYILGDEGSGSYLGKSLIRDYFYNKLPVHLSQKFKNEYDTDIYSVIEHIYHKEQVSQYLASFSRFLYDYKDEKYVKNLCRNSFETFVDIFIKRYEIKEQTEIGFVGSIAYYFKDILDNILKDNNLKIGKVLKNPIEGLIEYHKY